MNNITYIAMPTKKDFQRDSSITFAFRSDDIIISRIDWLLDRYYESKPTKRAVMCDLFLTCNFWIKSFHEKNPRMRKERYPAVLAVFEVVVREFCDIFKCTRAKVADTMFQIYGRDMHSHGVTVDHGENRAKYFTKVEREIYRLRFKGGLAYQYQWWKRKPGADLHHADSKHAYTPIHRKGADANMAVGSENFGCFVMTVDRAIFMAKPFVGDSDSHEGIFHSSFTGGEVVSMAGTMLIKNGRIRAIRADSGHYQPTEMNMALLLQGLAMYGVNLHDIELFAFNGGSLGNAFHFIQSKMSWSEFEKQARAEGAHRLTTDTNREWRGLDPKFPGLKPPSIPPRPNQIVVQQQQPIVMPSSTREYYQTA